MDNIETIEIAPYKVVVDGIKEAGGEALKYCYQCGMCETLCPWNRVRQFSIRTIMHEAQLGIVPFESDDIWRCTTCGRCPSRCPRGVKIIEVFRAVRRLLTPDGVVPASVPNLRGVMTSYAAVGNPSRQEPSARGDWAQDLGVKTFTEGTDVLFFPCCFGAYDPRSRKVSVATAKVLQSAGVDFGILGAAEVCCGESVRKAGNEVLFKQLAKQNIKTFIDSGVKKIVVSSPHCYQAFKNEYPEFKANFEVHHVTEYVLDLVNKGQLKLNKGLESRITYHDPCYLGRHNGMFGEPRELLRKVPGLELVEMPDNRQDSLCCGGGGGRIFMETPKGERFSDLRVDQAVAVGASTLTTGCHYCITNFEDSRLALPENQPLEVKDVMEIIQAAI